MTPPLSKSQGVVKLVARNGTRKPTRQSPVKYFPMSLELAALVLNTFNLQSDHSGQERVVNMVVSVM